MYCDASRDGLGCVLMQPERVVVTPQTRGSVDYPSTHGIPVNVG